MCALEAVAEQFQFAHIQQPDRQVIGFEYAVVGNCVLRFECKCDEVAFARLRVAGDAL